MKNKSNRKIVGMRDVTMGALLLLALAAFAPGAWAAGKPLNIVTTTPDLASIAKEVGRGHVETFSIGGSNQNLHMVEAKPSFMLKANAANLWICVGLQLEAGYEPLILQGARNAKIQKGEPGYLDASAGIAALEIPNNQVAAESGLTMGDIHPLGNPHYWTDPANMRIVARNIAEQLKKLDAANAVEYDANLADFLKRVDEASFGPELVKAVGGDKLWEMESGGKLDDYLKANPTPALDGWLGQMRPLRGAKIITYHRSWSYFAHRFGLNVVEEVEPKPGIPPSPGHIAKLIKKMKAENIRIILMEPFYERNTPDKIAQEAGAAVVEAPFSVGGVPAAKDYVSLIDTIVSRLLTAAQKQGLIAGSAS